MTAADRETLSHAAALLDGEALALRMAHTVPPDYSDWAGEPVAKAAYDDMRATVAALYAMAEVV